MIVEQDETAEKLKERNAELQKQAKVLRDNLQESSGAGSQDKIALLLEKQNKLVKQLRESDVRQLATQRMNLEMWQVRAKQDIVLAILP